MSNKTNIEEDIKILQDLKDKKIHFDVSYFTTGTVQLDEKEKQAIENILADRERLEKENEEYKKQLDLDYVEENYIKKVDIEKAINEARETIAKANKYDNLVEKIKNNVANNNFRETDCLEDKGRYFYGKELLDTEKQ